MSARRLGPHRSLIRRLADEGLRLFFPLAALHAALWPALWSLGQGFDLVFAQTTSPFLWHGYELLIGSYGAALLGFITTALPEWTGSPRPRGGFLYLLAAFWLVGRLAGLGGADRLGFLAALADLAWLAALTGFVAWVSIRRRTSQLLGFLLWLTGLSAAAATTRLGMLRADMEMAEQGLFLSAYAFLALLGLALARIHPLIVNLILDPSQTSTPFRPHPGRFNLAPGLLACVMAGNLAGVSDTTLAYLLMAAGTAFLDRVGESFVGKAFFRAEISALAGASFLAGTGLILWGASLLWGGFSPFFGLHIALMGGLGVATLGVFSVAGLLHTGHSLGLPWPARLALVFLAASLGVRLTPEAGGSSLLAYPSAALLWAAAFLVWLWGYWPWLREGLDPEP